MNMIIRPQIMMVDELFLSGDMNLFWKLSYFHVLSLSDYFLKNLW